MIYARYRNKLVVGHQIVLQSGKSSGAVANVSCICQPTVHGRRRPFGVLQAGAGATEAWQVYNRGRHQMDGIHGRFVPGPSGEVVVVMLK